MSLNVLYLAGPMTGVPQFNFPLFAEWATKLRGVGFIVINPSEEDPEEAQALARCSLTGHIDDLGGFDHRMAALRNVQGVMSADAIALLPGWQKSSGTRHEVETAHRFCLDVAPAHLWLALGQVNQCRDRLAGVTPGFDFEPGAA